MKLKKWLIGLVIAGALGFGAFQAFLYSIAYYAEDSVYTTAKGAIDGYDPVAYFTQSQPVQGKPEFSTEWNGARWHFSNAENLAAFNAQPERYAPQFGGYCAFAVANNYTAKIDPAAWHIADGKLYLNYDLSVREKWLAQRDAMIEAADLHWPKVLQN